MRHFISFLFAAWLLGGAVTFGQNIDWSGNYGGSYEDACHVVRNVPDGGYVLLGYTQTAASGDWMMYIVRIDPQGDTLWTARYANRGYDLAVCADGGFVIVASTSASNETGDIVLLRLDANGDSLWARQHGSDGDQPPFGIALQEDGGFAVCGRNAYLSPEVDALVVGFDADGNERWRTSLGEPGRSEELTDIHGLVGGGYVVCGASGEYGPMLARLDDNGRIMWQRRFESGNARLYGVDICPNGDFVACGVVYYGYSQLPFNEAIVIRVDPLGDSLWAYAYEAFCCAGLREIVALEDGSMLGYGTDGEYIYLAGLLMKLDQSGALMWEQTYQPAGYPTIGQSLTVDRMRLDASLAVAGTYKYAYEYPLDTTDLYVLRITDTSYLPTAAPICALAPDPMPLFYAHAIDTVSGLLYLGNLPPPFGGDDIHIPSLLINGSIAVTDIAVLPFHPDFSGEVLVVSFPAAEFVSAYGVVWDTIVAEFTVTGQYTDGSSFSSGGKFLLMGHISGDVNSDGGIDISDIIYLVDFAFSGGPEPPYLPAADMDCSGGPIDISDMIYLVEFVFAAGPEPLSCR